MQSYKQKVHNYIMSIMQYIWNRRLTLVCFGKDTKDFFLCPL